MSAPTVHLVYAAFEFCVPAAQCLKSKRKVVKSLKDRLASRFNASVAEVACQDQWQRSVIGVAMLSNDKAYLDQQLEAIRRVFDGQGEAILANVEVEWL